MQEFLPPQSYGSTSLLHSTWQSNIWSFIILCCQRKNSGQTRAFVRFTM